MMNVRTTSSDLPQHSGFQMIGELRWCAIYFLAALALGCDSESEGPSEEALSPVTEIPGEITSRTHLEQLEGWYRDRENLLSETGTAHAGEWGMSLAEAIKHANEGIGFHIQGVFSSLAVEEGDIRTRASLANVIADYATVAEEEVLKDIDRIDDDITFPEEVARQ